MDPISQATLGALAARVVVPNSFCAGARAPVLVVGAIAGALPDIDVLFSVGGDFYDQLITHRGITHSLFFAPVIGPLLGWLVWRYRSARTDEPERGALGWWMLACTVALWSHPLLDVLTPYGTQLLLPFSDARFAVFAMPIIDPVYTVALCVGVWAALRLRAARLVAGVVLLVSSAYLAYGWHLHVRAADFARQDLAGFGVAAEQVEAFPTILQPYARRVVARTPERDYVGFVSMWEPCSIPWTSGRRAPEELGRALELRRDGRVFSWFAMGWTHYGLADGGETLIAADLRYGTEDDPRVSVFSIEVPIINGTVADRAAVGGRYRPDFTRVDQVVGAAFGACIVGSTVGG